MRYLKLKEQLLNEINMSPSSLRREAKAIGARAGMEFEMIVPGAAEADDDYDMEADYDSDERINRIQDAFDFFYDGDYNSRRDCQELVDRMRSDYQDWLSDQASDRWAADKEEMIYDWLRYNAAPSDVFGILGVEEDENGNFPDPTKDDYRNAAKKVAEDNISPWYDDAEEDFNDNFYSDSDLESEWLEHEGIDTMADVESNYNITWPHYYNPNTGGEVSVEDAADSFSRAVGREVQASQNYHSRSVERPSASKLHYVVEPDGSLEPDDDSDGGLEFVSPALPIDELLDDLKKVKAWADKTGCYTNDSTGLHINVSVPAWQGDLSKLDYVKLAILMGDEYVLENFGRTGNSYAKSALKIVKDNIRQRPEDVKRLLDTMKDHLNTSAAKLIHSGSTNKYTSVNTKDGYIEFRSPGGDWLNENFDKIESTLLRFVVAMDAAADETKYREEYAKKLYKLLAGNDKDTTNTLVYFAKYAAGEMPAAALKSFIKQAQYERSVSKEPAGKKMWWRVDKEGRGASNSASVEIVATSKEEALEKAAVEWNTRLSALAAADAYPVRPYEEPGQQNVPKYEIFNLNTNNKVEDAEGITNDRDALIRLNDYLEHGPHRLSRQEARNTFGIRRVGGNGEPILAQPIRATVGEPQPAGSVGQPRPIQGVTDIEPDISTGSPRTDRPFVWKVIGNSQSPYQSQGTEVVASSEFEAMQKARQQWNLNTSGQSEQEFFRHGGWTATPVRPAPVPGSTQDLQQQRVQGGFTGAWKVTVDGEEVYRFSGIGNNQMDANRIGREWARNQISRGLLYPSGDIEVVPVMG